MNNPVTTPRAALNAQIITTLEAEVGGNKRAPEKLAGWCPVHETEKTGNKTLLVYENTDGSLGFQCTTQGCSHQNIIKAIEKKLGISIFRPGKKTEDTPLSGQVNYPAHTDTLDSKYIQQGDIVYEYHIKTGEVAFLVRRRITDGEKDIRPFFSKTMIQDTGITEQKWDMQNPPKSGRPIYNLFELTKNPTKDVLVVEGEKTAEAAKRIKELSARFVVTTWSGGTGTRKHSDWSPLKSRKSSIYLWPDHDNAGIVAMEDIASYCANQASDQRFFILSFDNLPGLPEGWDVADDLPATLEYTNVLAEFKAFTPIQETGTLEEELLKLDKTVSRLNLNGKVMFVDLNVPIDNSVIPYAYWKAGSDLKAERNKWVSQPGKKEGSFVKVSVVDEWVNQPNPKYPGYIGLAYRPDKPRVIATTQGKKINLFTGFPDFGTNTSNMLVDLIQDFMDKFIPISSERTWLLDQVRLSRQKPQVKPGNAIILIGVPGTGKSTFVGLWTALLGSSNARPLGTSLTSAHNESMARSLLMYWEEFYLNHKNKPLYNKYKSWITEPVVSINPKGIGSFEVESFHRFINTSNNFDCLVIPPDDRRFYPCQVSDALKDNKVYFSKIRAIIDPTHSSSSSIDETTRLASLAGLVKWLMETPITTNIFEIPQSQLKSEMSTLSSPVIELLRQSYDLCELPAGISDFLPVEEVDKFGRENLILPQSEFIAYIKKTFGQDAFNAQDTKDLKKAFMELAADGINTKIRNLRVRTTNGTIERKGKCYVLPPILKGRQKIEEIAHHKLRWEPFVADLEGIVDIKGGI